MTPHTAATALITRPVISSDRQPLVEVLNSVIFTEEEIEVALELIDEALNDPESYYRVIVAELNSTIVGYACYGHTPMTATTYDFYWLATHSKHQGKGIGRALMYAGEQAMATAGGRLIRLETSSLPQYSPAVRLYLACQYTEVARLKGFYAEDDDLIILTKHLA